MSTQGSPIDQNTIRRRGTGLRVLDRDRACPGYTLFAPLTGQGEVYLIDLAGQVVHQWTLPYRPGGHGYLLPHGNLFYGGKGPEDLRFFPVWSNYRGGVLVEVDPQGTILWEHRCPDHHHDACRLRNGNVVLLGLEKVPPAFVPHIRGGIPGSEVHGDIYGDVVREITPDGTEVWTWRAHEHLDPALEVLHPQDPRHHFGISANPLAMFVAAAQHTQRIRFRALCHTLPLHHPLLLAGAIAEADLLTHGRLECGLGRGHAWLYPPASISLAESRPRYEEALDLLTLAWTQERFSYEGRYYRVNDVTVVPKPLQKPHPKIYMVGTSESSFIAAGTRGVSIAAGGPVPYAVYAPGIDGYRQACAERGSTPDISFIRLVYLDEDEKQVRTEAERYVRNFLDFNASAIDSLAHRKEELTAAGYGLYASGVVERWRHITYDQCIEEELCFLGTPEQVIEQIRRLDQQIGGLNEMVIISNFGGIEHWKAIKTQHLFAQYVMPALRSQGGKAA